MFLDRNFYFMTALLFIYLTLWFYVLGYKWLFYAFIKCYSFFFSFNLKLTRSLHLFHLWYRGKRRHLRKPYTYYLVFKEKQLHFKNYYIVRLLFQRALPTSWRPLITFRYSPFILTFFILLDFTMYQFSTGFFCWWLFVLLYTFIKLHVWLLLIFVWCLNVLGVTYKYYVG